MQYISFYKDRLPFKPKTNVVIYFDVMGVGRKYYSWVIEENYDRIVREFRRGGLELFLKEKHLRKSLYDKLAGGISFKKAMAEEDYFVDEDPK